MLRSDKTRQGQRTFALVASSARLAVLLVCLAAPVSGDATAGFLAEPLPGAPPLEASVADALRSAWGRRPAGYQPRTKHLQPDGTPNRASLHRGMPVVRGHKIIITKWFRERGTGPMLYED